MSNVLRLVSSQEKPSARACSECRHFHPDTNGHGFAGWKFLIFGPGKRPSSNAMRFAACSAFGGGYAAVERKHECKGSFWEPAS